jgi:hypothetical protein
MDQLREFLKAVQAHAATRGLFLGLLHILIGRRITRADGTLVSAGMTWREVAALFKKLRFDIEVVRELNLDPAELPPRDRVRFWYAAISQAGVDSPAATAAGDRLAKALAKLGYEVGSAPGAGGEQGTGSKEKSGGAGSGEQGAGEKKKK